MGDTEAMYYQVQVFEEERGVLKFLWWEDGNLGDLLDHEMCAYIFGGTSSPGSCNYAFQKTAIANKVRYGEEASETLLHNFCVDDLLKSLETEELAIRLIRDVKAMYKAGGFNLTNSYQIRCLFNQFQNMIEEMV